MSLGIKTITAIGKAFKDSKGNTSLMRWLALFVVATGLIYPFTVEVLSIVDAGLSTSLVTLGLGGKYMQKKVEEK